MSRIGIGVGGSICVMWTQVMRGYGTAIWFMSYDFPFRHGVLVVSQAYCSSPAAL